MVIDASVVFKWFFPEEDHEKALDWVAQTELVAPTLLHAELGNALWKRIVRGEIAAAANEVGEYLAMVADVVRAVDETAHVPRAVEIAAMLRHPVYDCIYLSVAEATDDELLTADERFLLAIRDTPFAARTRRL